MCTYGKSRSQKTIIEVLLIIYLSISLFADPVEKPYNFRGGDAISAAAVNANFDTLYDMLGAKIDGENLKSNVGIGTTSPTHLFM